MTDRVVKSWEEKVKRPRVCWEEIAIGTAIQEQCLYLSETCVPKREQVPGTAIRQIDSKAFGW